MEKLHCNHDLLLLEIFRLNCRKYSKTLVRSHVILAIGHKYCTWI